jgi:GT2 family glycosyltransferase/glycosyltransferase involved in cell wall biosynthesis
MEYIKHGNQEFRSGNYKLALDLYLKAKDLRPDLMPIISQNINRTIERLKSVSNTVDNNFVKINPKKHKAFEGRLEVKEQPYYRGWAVSRDEKEMTFSLDILIDDIFYKTISNNDRRPDLLRAGKSGGLGGFNFSIPDEIISGKSFNLKISFPGGEDLVNELIPKTKVSSLIRRSSINKSNSVSVIIPVFNALEDLRVCFERLMKYTDRSIDLIFINDASSDANVSKYLDSISIYDNVKILTNQINLGFTKTVNIGINFAGNNDVILLNSDARVTPRWLQGIQRAAATSDNIATVTPMSDRAGAFSAPLIGNENSLPIGVSEADYAVAFRRNSIGYYPTVPTGNGFCMYIRRQCINEIGLLDEIAFPRGYGEENDFCMRARLKGWRNIIDDRTYVFHDRSKSFGSEKDVLIKSGRNVLDEKYLDYGKAIKIFSKSENISAARFKAKIAQKASKNGVNPRVLYVISTLTGGTPQTNRDLMYSLSDAIEPWLLRCDVRTVSLYKVNAESDDLIDECILLEPVDPLTHASSDYDEIVKEWIAIYDFEIVHIRHIAWHSINLPKIAKLSGCRVIKSFHDFYDVCPSVKLIDNNLKYCHGVCTSSAGDCAQPLWGAEDFPKLKNGWVSRWRDIFAHSLNYCDAFVTTSVSARETILNNLTLSKKIPFEVIPHGRDFSDLRVPDLDVMPKGVLKILVPGNIDSAKGLNVIKELLKSDKNHSLEFHILGACEELFHDSRVVLHGAYKRDDFVNLVSSISPHLGVVFSIWDETWCHTLTEIWAAGLPAIVFNYPTISARVEKSSTGWVFENNDINGLNNLFRQILLDCTEYKLKLNNVIAWQKYECIFQSKKFMAINYFNLYKNTNVGGDFIALLSPSDKSLISAPGSTHVRIWEKTKNSLSRALTYIRLNEDQFLAGVSLGFVKKAIIQRNALSKNNWNGISHAVINHQVEFILDLDDDLLDVPKDKDPKGEYVRYSETLSLLCIHAKAVTVSTDKLLNKYSSINSNTKLIENCLNVRTWPEPVFNTKVNSSFNLLYFGSASHTNDLEMIIPAIKMVKSKIPELKLFIVGVTSKKVSSDSWIEFVKVPDKCKNYVNFVPFLREIAATCHVGLAPLEETDFNSHKSCLKLTEYSGLGLRVVASNVEPYCGFYDEFNGGTLTSNTSEDWIFAILEEYKRLGSGMSLDDFSIIKSIWKKYILQPNVFDDFLLSVFSE